MTTMLETTRTGRAAHAPAIPRRRRLRRAGILAAVAVTLVGGWVIASPVGVAATKPVITTITLVRDKTADHNPDGWSATGALTVNDGTWSDCGCAFNGAIPAPTEFNFHQKTTQVSPAGDGTFGMDFIAEGNQSQVNRSWEIVDGTGIYQGLHGTGSWTRELQGDGSIHYICTGDVSIS